MRAKIPACYPGAGRQPWHLVFALCLVLRLATAALGLHWDAAHPDLDRGQAAFIGWEGETYRPPAPSASLESAGQELGSHAIDLAAAAPPAAGRSQRWVQLLSWHPRLHLHRDFLSDEEAQLLRAELGGSTGSVGEQEQAARWRLVADIEQRVANWSNLPPSHLEGWQIQHGFSAADATLHTDLLTDRLATENFQRVRTASVLLFLGDGSSDGGGRGSWSLVFPMARGGAWRGSAEPHEYAPMLAEGRQVQELLLAGAARPRGARAEASVLQLHVRGGSGSGTTSRAADVCASGAGVRHGLKLTGFRRGDALLLWNVLVDGETPDAAAAHVVCTEDPPAASEAAPWIATTWLHNMPLSEDDPLALAASCADKNPACRSWAEQGFCDDAPGVMLGLRGLCRASCEDCTSCEHLRAGLGSQHAECLFGNMRSQRAEWSQQARGAGVRRARNAIRRDLRLQAAAPPADVSSGGAAEP